MPKERINWDYRSLLSTYSSGYWYKFPREFLFLMSSDEAIILSSLIDAAVRFFNRYKKARERGTFYYTIHRMQWDTGLDDQKQDRVIRSLIQKNYIRKERRGSPPKRYFWINIDLLNQHTMEVRAKREAEYDKYLKTQKLRRKMKEEAKFEDIN